MRSMCAALALFVAPTFVHAQDCSVTSVGLTPLNDLGVVLVSGTPVFGQRPSAYRAPRSEYGDGKPTLNGIWQALNVFV